MAGYVYEMNDPKFSEGMSLIFAHKAEITAAFYKNLFRELPQAQGMFQNNERHQKEMFGAMLCTIARSMGDGEAFDKLCKSLAKAHAHLGLDRSQHQIAGDALLSAMTQVLGDKISLDSLQIWRCAIDCLTARMANAGRELSATRAKGDGSTKLQNGATT